MNLLRAGQSIIVIYTDIPTKAEIARQRRAIKLRKKPDVATLEMKLNQSANFRPSTATGGKPRSLADLKLGMNSVNKSGIQQNTT